MMMNLLNHIKDFNKRISLAVVAGIALLTIHSCSKVVNPDTGLPDSKIITDTVNDIVHKMAGMSNATLFTSACNRVSLSSQLNTTLLYTVFVPTDSAMKAEGYTADVINSLSIDSLNKIVQYHVVYSEISDTALTAVGISVQEQCLLSMAMHDPDNGDYTYQYFLYLKIYGGKLNINGWTVNAGEMPVRASNGYLYTIHVALQPPAQTLLSVIKQRPELSYYYAAMKIIDSINKAKSATSYPDTALFATYNYVSATSYGTSNGVSSSSGCIVYPTVFAPTNTAFINAGLVDVNAIRNLIINSLASWTITYNSRTYTCKIPGTSYYINSGGRLSSQTNYIPFDSVMKMHYLYGYGRYNITSVTIRGNGTGNLLVANLISYSDLTGCAFMNNGYLNKTNPYNSSVVLAPYILQFGTAGNGLNIQWNTGATNNAVIRQDATQLTASRNIWAINGVILESDVLFKN